MSSRDFPEFRRFSRSFTDFPEIPDFLNPFRKFWWNLALARRSGSKKAARGCPRIQIWSHEGPNQSQNHGFESDKKPWFCSSGKQEGQGSKRTRTTPCASETSHFLFFPAKTRTLEKRHAKLMTFGQISMIFDQQLSKFEPKCSGPAFFVVTSAKALQEAENIDFP